MYQMLRLTIAAMTVIFASFPTSAPAQVPATQLKLTLLALSDALIPAPYITAASRGAARTRRRTGRSDPVALAGLAGVVGRGPPGRGGLPR